MSKRLNQLREERNRIVTQARDILNKAETEKRALSAEEDGKYGELFAKQDELRKTIEAEERQVDLERQLAAGDIAARGDAQQPGAEARQSGPRGTEEYRAAYGQMLRGGVQSLNAEQVRALSVGAGTEGGFLVMPEQMVDGLIKSLDDDVVIRMWATKYRIPTAASLGVPTLDADPADADWTAEILTGSEDSTMAFGKRELSPNPLAKRIKVSNKLLRMSPGVEALVMSRLAYKFGITEEKAFLTGTGNKSPLGVFTASNDGIPTSRDVSTDNTSTAMTMLGLVNAKYALKAPYQRRAKWLFHRDGIKQIAKFVDTAGQFLWQPSKKEGEPDMLLGSPVYQSENAPNTFTTGKYVGMYADFSYYWIADALDVQIQRLVELYAETNQTGFIGRKETDGMPVLAEAFSRVKLA